jgi:hypothetical protein
VTQDNRAVRRAAQLRQPSVDDSTVGSSADFAESDLPEQAAAVEPTGNLRYADPTSRTNLLLGLQRQRGNGFVQRVVASASAPPVADAPAVTDAPNAAPQALPSSPVIAAPPPPVAAPAAPAPAPPEPATTPTPPPAAAIAPPLPAAPPPAPLATPPAPQTQPVAAPPGPALVNASPPPAASVATPQSPRGTELLQRIQQAAEGEKARVHDAAEQARTTTLALTNGRADAILAEAQVRAQALLDTATQRKGEVAQSFAAAHASGQAQIDAQQAAAAAEGDAAVGRLHEAVAAKRQAATEAAAAQAAPIEQTGQSQGARATDSATTSIASITQIAQAKSSQATGSPDVQQAVREGVEQTASAAVTQVRDNGNDTAQKANEAATTAATAIRNAGTDLASGLGDNVGQIEDALRQSTSSTVQQIANVGAQHLQALADLQATILAGLDSAANQAAASVRQGGESTASQVRQLGDRAVADSTQMEADSVAQIDSGVQQAADLLAQTGQEGPAPEQGTGFADGATQTLHDGADDLIAGFAEQSTSVSQAVDAAEAAFSGQLEQSDQSMAATFDTASSTVAQNVTDAEQGFAEQCDGILTAARDANQQSIDQYAAGLQEQIDQAVAKWTDNRQTAEADIQRQVDDAVAGHSQTVTDLPGHLDEVAQQAADQQDESILGAIWGAIVNFAEGMLKFLAIVLIVFAIAVLIFEAPFALATFLVCAAVVGLAFMAYSFLFETLPRRLREMASVFPSDAPWYVQALAAVSGTIVAVAAAAGDVVGVSQLVEGAIGQNIVTGAELTPAQRAAKITTGLLMIGTLFLFKAVAKTAGAGGGEGEGDVSGEDQGEVPGEEDPDFKGDDNPPITEPARRGCFVAGTLVLTADGLRPIESVHVGDLVCALDPVANVERLQRVLRTFVRTADATVTLHVGSEAVCASLEHPFWVPGRGWVEAGSLTPGTPLLARDNQVAFITSVKLAVSRTTVHNLEVEGVSTFRVSASGIVVHNKAMQIPQEPVGDLSRPSAKWWKQQGVDPHEIKDDLGEPGSHFDLYVDRAGNIWALRKGAPKSTAIYMGNIDQYGGGDSNGGGEPPSGGGGDSPPDQQPPTGGGGTGGEPPDIEASLERLDRLELDPKINSKIRPDLRQRLSSPDAATRQAAEAELRHLEEEAAWAQGPTDEGNGPSGGTPFTLDAAFNEVFDRYPSPLNEPPWNTHPRGDYEPVRFEPEGSDRPGEIRRVLVIRGKVGDVNGRIVRFSIAWDQHAGSFEDIHEASGL